MKELLPTREELLDRVCLLLNLLNTRPAFQGIGDERYRTWSIHADEVIANLPQ